MHPWLPPARILALSLVASLSWMPETARAQISWVADTVATGVNSPTSLAFGPDGRLYVLELNGRIRIYTLGPDRKPVATQVVNTINTDPNGTSWACLGIAFDPLSPPDSVRVFVSRTRVYQPAGVGAYLGRLTKLTGPNFLQPVEVISGLPVSRMDHANNNVWFGDDGHLYLQQGGNTNAGVPGAGLNGNRQEGPLSAATLVAYLRRPGFDGGISYSDPDPGLAQQTGGLDVEVFAPGMRNPYDIVMHTNGYLYGTDNGPNSTFNNGTLWDCDSIGPPITESDEINLIERGRYYGHPNQPRASADPRQCLYHRPTDPALDGHTPPLRVVTPSTNGILEYRSRSFPGDSARGDLYTARFDGGLGRADLAADGRSITRYVAGGPMFGSLDIAEGPDGALFGVRYSTNQVLFQAPVNNFPATGPRAVRLWPERGPHDQPRTVKLSGSRLGISAAPVVTLGGVPLSVLQWSASSLTLVIPPMVEPGWYPLVVSTYEGSDTMTAAYRVIRPSLADGDTEAPRVRVLEPERRWYDQAPPLFTIRVRDRLGVDSVQVRRDGGPWETLAAAWPDSAFEVAATVPFGEWQAAADGEHTVEIRARDDAGNISLESWSWLKGLPSAGIVRINSGGAGQWSSLGRWFSPDSAVVSGHVELTDKLIAKTADQAIFQDARVGDVGQTPPDYRLNLPNRAYELRLWFAEIDTALACAGCRVFDVIAEDLSVLTHLDLADEVGAFHATTRTAETLVTDGELCLTFAPGSTPLLSAFEVIPLGLSDVTPPLIADIPEPQGFNYSNSPMITVQAQDPADGEIAAIQYSIDGAPWKPVIAQVREKQVAFTWTMPIVVLQNLSPGPHSLRLRVVDLAGHVDETAPWAFERNSIVGVETPQRPRAALRVWPNPARGAALHLEFAQPEAGDAEVTVHDLAGRVVLSRALEWQLAGTRTTALDLEASPVPAGLYFVRVRAPGVQRTERVIRMR